MISRVVSSETINCANSYGFAKPSDILHHFPNCALRQPIIGDGVMPAFTAPPSLAFRFKSQPELLPVRFPDRVDLRIHGQGEVELIHHGVGVSDEVFVLVILVVVLVVIIRVPDDFGQWRLRKRALKCLFRGNSEWFITGSVAPTSDKSPSLYPEIIAEIVTSPFLPEGLNDIKAVRRESSR